MTHLVLKCLLVTVFYCLHFLVYVMKLSHSCCPSFMLSFFLIHHHIWMSFASGVTPSFFILHCHMHSVFFASLCSSSLYISSHRLYEKQVFKVWKELFVVLWYLLNATGLTLSNNLMARTGHTQLQATPHVNTCEPKHILTETRVKSCSREVTRARTKCGCTEHQRWKWLSWIKEQAYYRSHEISPLTLLALTAQLQPTADYS